jgi:hypothetical protein
MDPSLRDDKTGHGAFTVYYAGRGEMLRRKRNRKGKIEIGKSRMPGSLAFVTDGALLGIKPVGSDAEHIVALDADAMDYGTDDRARLG